MDETFDATKELQQIREIRTISKKEAYRKSSLLKYRAELVCLIKTGGSYGDLKAWLRIKKRMNKERSTIYRFLKQLPEMQDFYKKEDENA